jgi:hypothetical protein
VISPGEDWTPDVLERALEFHLQLVSSYYLALRDHDRFCWAQHVCAPYLDEPAASWFDSGLPVVGYFHDRDLALGGVKWACRALDRWQDGGAKRFMDFRELAAALCCRFQIREDQGSVRLKVTSDGSLPLVKPLVIALRSCALPLPTRLSVDYNGRNLTLPVRERHDRIGYVELPRGKSPPLNP